MTVNPKPLGRSNHATTKTQGVLPLHIFPSLQRSSVDLCLPSYHLPSAHHNPTTTHPLPIMVAIAGHELLRRAVGILRTHYNRCLTKLFHGKPTTLGPSSSFVHTNLNRPFPKVAPVPPKKTWVQAGPNVPAPKGRKQGRVRRKGYNELARDNSTIFMPGGFHKPAVNGRSKGSPQGNDEPGDSETAYTAKAKRAAKDRRERRANRGTANEKQAFVKKQIESLMFDKLKREAQFSVKEVSERVKREGPERRARMRKEAMEAEKVWKMEELQKREEKERAERWKDQRLAQLEGEKRVAETELAHEKAERKRSKLQRESNERQRKHREEAFWKQLREKDAKLAADRESNLLHENAMLENNLRATDDAFRRACNERDYVVVEKEEERTRRLRAEESLYRWKELMKEYFPRSQQMRHLDQQQDRQQNPEPEPEQYPPLESQFELYEKKWEILRSGVDIDGSKIHLISFSQIPWPVFNITPTGPNQIRPGHIQEFLTYSLCERPDASGKIKSTKVRVKDELLKWHGDKFDQIVISKVCEEDRPAASEAAGMIARVLTKILK